MRIHILCVSKRPRDWVTQATTEYVKRLRGQLEVVIREIAPAVKQPSKAAQLEKEAERLRRVCPRRAYTIALDERGDQWSTSELAANLDGWRARYTDVVCFIGGAEGLAPDIVAAADRRWSLSRLTLPHQFAKVLLVEQFYRGWSLLHNHPYHRA
jgi:23S rRNA (pseudouridine1915-N3)-methyltransferase